MDEDAGVKAPVTRLRRRMSVEQTEEKSPAISTPTKKRAGRRTAKPDLELIDENTPDNTTRQATKKTAAKDVIDTIEEKPMTPSRRSTRIRSNTSIVSETVTIDSPRAKRAARRTSQLGSDSEAPPTPVRQTRRTRKDSASSIEKGEIPSISKPQITEAIEEEPENNQRKSTSGMDTSNGKTPTKLRKSPRLVGKNKKRNSNDTEEENSIQVSDVIIDNNKKSLSRKSVDSVVLRFQDLNSEEILKKDRLSISTANLIENLNTESKPASKKLNKSTTAIGSKNNVKKERVRTKSCTMNTTSNETSFFSDNESVKKKISKENKQPTVVIEKFETSKIINKSLNQDTSVKSPKNQFEYKEDEIDSSLLKNNQRKVENIDKSTIKLFDKEPSSDIQTLVYIEDSDTNSGKTHSQKRHEQEDQCVPVVDHPIQPEKEQSLVQEISDKDVSYSNKSKSIIMNNSCEPMDIDETIPEPLQISEINSSVRKSISTIDQQDLSETSKEKSNKSKRKSSISNTLNKTETENKSTLILSQLKDASTGDTDNIKSPLIKNSILSKTVDDLNSTQENGINKKNLSLTCVTTSTPLQQKKLQRLGNINTSIIANNDEKDTIDKSKINVGEKENISAVSKSKSNHNSSSSKIMENKNKSASNNDYKDTDNFSKSKKKDITMSSNNDSSNDMDSEEESEDNSNMLDDEADEAGDDYESGDSQNEEERQYLKDNEILEKGETLSTDGDISNDSDYEKDSFVVSSEPEDDELLEGTDDDLSMSDNELKMTTKSKNKYDERKKKESKKASKEMYESRHKLNDSNKSNTSEKRITKKNKRQQLSSSESEEEIELKTKKTNRMRLDSSHETSLLANNENNKSNTKSKQLSESLSEEDVLNEKELSISNETIKENDPLANIKSEPKTPQENLSLAFINTDKDPNNDSELTRTQTELDPLDDQMTDDSLSSDNENIMQNYDSVLEGLNKSSKTKSKVCDISLNIEKKKTKKEKNTIVDELNLTQVKSPKKSKNKDKKEKLSSIKDKKAPKPDLQDNESSDSIDLHLLFSEDSSNSEDVKIKKNNKSVTEQESLKTTKGRISLSENAEKSKQDKSSSNLSVNHKDIENVLEAQSSSEDTESNNVNFFIDTEGTNMSLNKNLNTSMKKNNKQTSSVNDENSDSDAPMDIPFKKDKPIKENEDENEDENGEDETDFVVNKSLNKSLIKTPVSEKKKKKAEDSQILKEIDTEDIQNESINMSINSAKKQKKKSISESIDNKLNEKDTEENNKSIKTPKSGKKKQKSLSEDNIPEKEELLNISQIKTPGSQKKKKLSIQAQNNDGGPEKEELLNISQIKTPGSQKKKKLSIQAQTNDDGPEKEELLNISQIKTPGSQKKKKLSIQAQNNDDGPVIPEALNSSNLKTPDSEKKQSVTKSSKEEVVPDQIIILSSGKKNKTHSNSFTSEKQLIAASELYDSSSKKRKRKSSLITAEDNVNKDDLNIDTSLNESVVVASGKKKRKISQNNETFEEDIHSKVNETLVGKKKRKISQNDNNVSDIIAVAPVSEDNKEHTTNISGEIKLRTEPGTSAINNIGITKKNKNKKRKQREDDEGNNVVKVFKENSFDKIHVQRLPASILNQLDEKPKPISCKKSKVVSTSNFLVQEAKKRKNKPSNFLEETICLNEDKTEGKKIEKKHLLKPKVLPFVPTAVTSACGFTTNFKVNVIPRETKFIAQSNTVANFKDDYLFNKKIKRQGTYELYKRKRNIKISKF